MNFYVIGDSAMVEAFELIGIPGEVVGPGQEIAPLLDRLARAGSDRLVLVQSGLAASLSDEYLDQLARRWSCLVLETPGVGEAAPERDDFLRSVQTAIGAVR